MSVVWPPEYTVRKSSRAKQVHLQFHLNRGLEVVIPAKLRRNVNVNRLLKQHRIWIEHRQREMLQHSSQQVMPLPPTELNLPAIEQTWQIICEHKDVDELSITERENNTLHLVGPTDDVVLLRQVFRQWLQKKGREHLCPWLHQLALETGLVYRYVSIRGQKTRWGSCSSKRDISLNWKILFLPSKLARHIMLHELCHLQYLDHSTAFWDLLARFDDNMQTHREACRRADNLIPHWLE